MYLPLPLCQLTLPLPMYREEYSLLNAAFMIIRGRPIPLNVSTLQIPGGHKCYMCLLASWGIVADIDIESEKLRKLGQSRFILGKDHIVLMSELKW